MSFTTENLISEIEKRPAIWDMKIPEYSDKNIRRKCWEEVTECFSKEGCSEKEKNSLNSLLQKKWKNIRDRFNREFAENLRAPMETRKKVPYMYSRQLAFLRDTLSFRKTTDSLVTETTVCGETESSLPSTSTHGYLHQPTSTSTHEYLHQPTSTSTAEEAINPPPRKKSRLNNFQVEKKIMEVLECNMKERAEIAKKMQEQEKNKEEDAERLFLLSLLPTLKSIHPKCLLKAKIAIMNVLDEFPKINSIDEDRMEEILPTENEIEITQIKIEKDGFWEENCNT